MHAIFRWLCLASLVSSISLSTPTDLLAATRTWDGEGSNNLWSNGDNWNGNTAPLPGDALVFPAGITGLVQNDFPANTEFASLTVFEGYRIAGQPLTIASGIFALPGPANERVSIECDIVLKGPGTITMSAPTDTTLALFEVFGPATATLRKEGAGVLDLIVNSLYAGPTIIANGRVNVHTSLGLGQNAQGTTVHPSGVLVLVAAGLVISEPLTLQGTNILNDPVSESLIAEKTADLIGAITLSGFSRVEIGATAGTTLSITSVISGTQGLVFSGDGTFTLSGAGSNTYNGLTVLSRGTVRAGKAFPAVAIPAGLTIGTASGPKSAFYRNIEKDQIQGNVTVLQSGRFSLGSHNENIGALTLAGGEVETLGGVLTLGGNLTALPAPGVATLAGILSTGPGSLTIDVQTGDGVLGLDITAVISSPAAQGLVKIGQGVVRLSGENTYAGLTMISEGTVIVGHPSAFGGPTTTHLKPGGRIELEADVPNEHLFAEAGGPNPDGPTLASVGPGMRTWGHTILISGAFRTYASAGSTLRLNGAISGGHFMMAGEAGSSVLLGGNNTYSGNTVVSTRVALTGNHRIPDTSRMELRFAGKLDLEGFQETVGGIWSNSAASEVSPDGGALTVVTKNGNTDVFAGTLTGAGQIVKAGQGTWVLTGASAATAPIAVSDGTLRVTGSVASEVVVGDGTLEGTGHVGILTAPDGNVRPGSSPGILHSQSATFTSDANLHIAIDGPAVGTGHSQLQVTGTVTLGNAGLVLQTAPGFQPVGGSALVIVDNDGSDPIIGTFEGWPDGEAIVLNGTKFHINYAGGTGNDVALETQSDTYYLSEGATGSFFDLDILIANPNTDPAPVTITFLREDGGTVIEARTVPGLARVTVRVDDIAGVESTPVSTVVHSDAGLPLIVERTMRWDQSGYGAHTEKAAGGTALTWYFAEGAQGFFSTYLLLANPGPTPSTATVQYLREGASVVTRSYAIGPNSRLTVGAGDDPDLINSSFGMFVTFDQPGIAERAMYFGMDPVWKGGHESAGVTVPSTTWFLAEGATGPFFETFVLLANPNGVDVPATLTFLSSDGAPVVREKTIPANGRLTVNIESEDPALGNAAVSTQIASTQPIIVERAQYWPDPAPAWYEAHNSFGVVATGRTWGLAEGRAGGAEGYQTYVLIANPGTATAQVGIVFLLEDGTPIKKSFTVGPTSRFNVATGEGTDVPELANRRFGAIVISDEPIVVERAMYSNAGGQTWAAGTNATATRLPPLNLPPF